MDSPSVGHISIALLIMLIVILISVGIFLAIFLPIHIINKEYRDFVLEHSITLRKLKEITYKYSFKPIPNYDMEQSYDNENFYSDISPQDFLTYQLVFIQKQVNQALKDALFNKELYEQYRKEINEKIVMHQYDVPNVLSNTKKLNRIELDYWDHYYEKPTVSFSIYVTLKLTNINDEYRTSKAHNFGPKEIKDIIFKINQRRNGFYTNEEIWKSICRVERGKVTNKMRFAIYQRDGYRCRICGRRGNGENLEIDHIYPIAKGGKSTYDNLQTLCHNCNQRKGSNII